MNIKKLIAILLLLPTLGCQDNVQGTSVSDQVIMVNDQDKEMNAAIAKAQATLDDFLLLVQSPPAGSSQFKLKVKVVDGVDTEHLWVMPFKKTGETFSGTIVNEPTLVSSVAYGENYQFTREQITDWGYEQNGQQKGNYTVCAIFKHMPAEEVQMYITEYGFECKE